MIIKEPACIPGMDKRSRRPRTAMATRIARRTIDSTVGLEFSNILNAMYTNPKMSRIDVISI